MRQPDLNHISQTTRHVESVSVRCWTTVGDDGPTLNRHGFSVSCLPGERLPSMCQADRMAEDRSEYKIWFCNADPVQRVRMSGHHIKVVALNPIKAEFFLRRGTSLMLKVPVPWTGVSASKVNCTLAGSLCTRWNTTHPILLLCRRVIISTTGLGHGHDLNPAEVLFNNCGTLFKRYAWVNIECRPILLCKGE